MALSGRGNGCLAAATRLHWWAGITRDVAKYVTACIPCHRNKTSNSKPAGVSQPLPVPGDPWSEVAMDFVAGFPIMPKSYDVVMVVLQTWCDLHLAQMICSHREGLLVLARLVRLTMYWPMDVTCHKLPADPSPGGTVPFPSGYPVPGGPLPTAGAPMTGECQQLASLARCAANK